MKNEITILSRRNAKTHAGWVAIDEFEDVMLEQEGCRIIAPSLRKKTFRPVDRLINKFKSDLEIPEDVVSGGVLLVVARSPGDLAAIEGIHNVRGKFDAVIGFVIDSYYFDGYPKATSKYDHIFSTSIEGCEFIRSKYSVSTSVLRQGFDCFTWASIANDRCIDVIGYGRQPPSYHRALQKVFHTDQSDGIYLHSPIGSITGKDVFVERPMLLKLLQRSKLSLAFNLMVEPVNQRPKAQFVTSRWLESLATGCIVVGKKPVCEMADDMLSWSDSTIELADSASEAVEQIKLLVKDEATLQTMRKKNVYEMLKRHDWRYRIKDIYTFLNLEISPALVADMKKLSDMCASIIKK